MSTPITFKYFREPHKFSTYVGEARVCDLCGETRAGYGEPFYGLDDGIEFVCELCLAAGALAGAEVVTNSGRNLGINDIKSAHPNLSDAQAKELAQQRSDELETRTPHIETWQEMAWPVHCGDYCCYIKGAGKADFEALAEDGDAKKFFELHLAPEYADTDLDFLWESIRADSPKNNKNAYWTETYLFQCIECGEYLILWDCD